MLCGIDTPACRVPAGPGFPRRFGGRVPKGRAFLASASAASGPRPDSESGRGACRGGRKFCPFRAMIPAGFFACFRWKVLLVSEGKFCRFRTMIPAANGNFARFARQTAAGGQGLGWTRSGGPALDNGAGRRACRVAGGPGAAGEPRSGAMSLPSLEPAPSESTNGPGPGPGPGLGQETRCRTGSAEPRISPVQVDKRTRSKTRSGTGSRDSVQKTESSAEPRAGPASRGCVDRCVRASTRRAQ